MEEALRVINELERLSLIERYAIGGAVAATRYIEPMQTYDLDVFVMLQTLQSGLISISPIYAHLSKLGYVPQEECINIEGWPVQFLPVYNTLTEEALDQAVDVEFGETPTRVIGAEYLAAIMLDTGRPKDHARLLHFLEADVVDIVVLQDIAKRHGLKGKWENFRRRFL